MGSDNWEHPTLTDLADFAGGVAFPVKEQGRSSGKYPFYKVSDMNLPGNEIVLDYAVNWIDEAQRQRLGARIWPAGTVVFPKVGAALRTEKRRLLFRPSCFDNNIMGLVPKSNVLPRFLLALMERVRLGDLAQEGAVPSINQRTIAGLEFALPPLAEQRRITDVLLVVDLQGLALRRYAGTLKQLRRSGLASLCSQVENASNHKSLAEVAHIQQGKTLSVKEMAGGDHPVFGANGVIGFHDHGHYPHNVVAVGCRGSCGTIHLAKAGSFLANNVMAVWPIDPGSVEFGFLAPMLEAADLSAQGIVTGQVQPQITRRSLATLQVQVPSLFDQRRIAAFVEAVDRTLVAAEDERVRCDAMRSSLHVTLLSSEHRVPASYDRFLGRRSEGNDRPVCVAG